MISTLGFWNNKKEKLKEKYSKITDEDLTYCEGKEKEMIEILGNKLGKSREELMSIIESI